MQCSWTYIGRAGQPYPVHLYHGTHSGHLLISINNQIVLVDFAVWDSKNYSFFIEDDLCHIRLIKKNDRMHYQFEIDKEAPTPANERRNRFERQAIRKILLWLLGLFFIVLLFVLGIRQFEKRSLNPKDVHELPTHQTQTAMGIITAIPKKLPAEIVYAFMASDYKTYTGRYLLENTAEMQELLTSLHLGDSCTLIYSTTRPEVNALLEIKNVQLRPFLQEDGH